ncbi:MAG: hypothetical protein LBI84_02610 [Propionibacteriaceae bacterium]|jgi:Flp pilus assembly pilin Flp|nr:hypothetical protein [Propionibacteriaceae bacterium]
MTVWAAWVTSLRPIRRLRAAEGGDRGATTLEYVIIAAVVCAAAVILGAVLVRAISGFQDQIPSAP